MTLWRPWDWAVGHAGKDYENRTWPPPARVVGKLLALHGGKRFDREAADWIAERFGVTVPGPRECPEGITCIARVAGFVEK